MIINKNVWMLIINNSPKQWWLATCTEKSTRTPNNMLCHVPSANFHNKRSNLNCYCRFSRCVCLCASPRTKEVPTPLPHSILSAGSKVHRTAADSLSSDKLWPEGKRKHSFNKTSASQTPLRGVQFLLIRTLNNC